MSLPKTKRVDLCCGYSSVIPLDSESNLKKTDFGVPDRKEKPPAFATGDFS